MNEIKRHKVFISYYHKDDNLYKDYLIKMTTYDNIIGQTVSVFDDYSVHEDEVDDTGLTDGQIRCIIRDKYIKNATVLILLCGQNTKTRKHIDWEIHAAMYDSETNPKMGILVINLDYIHQNSIVCNDQEKCLLSSTNIWRQLNKDINYLTKQFPYMPDRVIENLAKNDVSISVIDWNEIINNPEKLKIFIDNAFCRKDTNMYNHSTPLRRKNST